MQLILASASPRRREILANLGVPFKIQISQVEEQMQTDLSPERLAEELALLKARNVAKDLASGLVLGADTIVVLDDKVLGKPASKEEAGKMLSLLSGRQHQVISGLALVDANTGKEKSSHEITTVWFRQLDTKEIDSYVATGEPMDKAGAYGIQGKGSLFVRKIEGCYFNVVGLPLTSLYVLLKEQGINLGQWGGENGLPLDH